MIDLFCDSKGTFTFRQTSETAHRIALSKSSAYAFVYPHKGESLEISNSLVTRVPVNSNHALLTIMGNIGREIRRLTPESTKGTISKQTASQANC